MSSILKVDTLQDVNGNAIISSDGSGNISIPNLTTTGNINLGDSDKIVFGAGSDFEILHNSLTGNLINLTSNPLEIHQTGTNSVLQLYRDTANGVIAQFFGVTTQEGSISTDTNFLKLNAENSLSLTSNSGIERMRFGSSEAVINEGSTDYDFRVESNNNTHTLFVDGGTDVVMIGKSNTSSAVAGTTLWSGGYLNSTVTSDYVARFNRTTTDGEIIQIYKDNASVGNIGANGSYIYTANAINVGLRFVGSDIRPCNSDGSDRDDAIDLGDGLVRFKDVYYSGSLAASTTGGLSFDTNGNAVFNEGSSDSDFRVESNNSTHMLYVDAGTDRVGIGQSSPAHTLHVTGGPPSGTDLVLFDNSRGSGTPRGFQLLYSALAPDDGNIAFNFEDSSTTRFRVNNDGDVLNHDGVYGTISDQRIKQNITDANSQWEDIKALSFKNFKKKDDVAQYGEENAPTELGLIAQELELTSPNLVKEYPCDEKKSNLHPDFNDWENSTIKGVKYSILYMKAVKALQEAMLKIEDLEARVNTLEGN